MMLKRDVINAEPEGGPTGETEEADIIFSNPKCCWLVRKFRNNLVSTLLSRSTKMLVLELRTLSQEFVPGSSTYFLR